MATNVLTIFWTVMVSVGIVAIYLQIDAAARRRSLRQHSLNINRQDVPAVVLICSLLLLLRYMSLLNQNAEYWSIINMLLMLIVFANISLESFSGFAVTQLVGAVIFGVSGVTSGLLWAIYFVTISLLRSQMVVRKQCRRRTLHRFWVGYGVLLVAAFSMFWLLMNHLYPRQLPLAQAWVHIVEAVLTGMAVAVLLRLNALTRKERSQLAHDVHYDALTGVRNWATFQSDFNQRFNDSNAEHQLAVMTFDIDRFKQINDRYGHIGGNRVLVVFSNAIKTLLAADFPACKIYRTGGEEFAVVMPAMTLQQATGLAQRCGDLVQALTVDYNGQAITMTASFGVTVRADNDHGATMMFKRADHNLYLSKERGRNRTTADDETVVNMAPNN